MVADVVVMPVAATAEIAGPGGAAVVAKVKLPDVVGVPDPFAEVTV